MRTSSDASIYFLVSPECQDHFVGGGKGGGCEAGGGNGGYALGGGKGGRGVGGNIGFLDIGGVKSLDAESSGGGILRLGINLDKKAAFVEDVGGARGSYIGSGGLGKYGGALYRLRVFAKKAELK